MRQVVSKDAVLTAVRLIGHDQDVVIRADRLRVRVVKLLDQGENEAGVAPQHFDQPLSAGGHELFALRFAQQAAGLKGAADLLVQLLPVSKHHDGGRALELPADLLRQEQHGIALAGALGMPEDAQLAIAELPLLPGLHGGVHAQVLMVPGQDLHRAPVGVIVEDEVFKQIEEVLFPADAPKHGLQRHAALVRFFQSLPFVEELILAAQGAHLGLQAVGEHQEGVVVEQVRNGVQVIGIVVGVGVLHIHIAALQLDEQQGQTVDKAHDVRPAAVEIAVNFELLHRQKVIVPRVGKVDHHGPAGVGFPVRLFHRDRDAVPDQAVLLLVDLQQRRGGQVEGQRLAGLLQLDVANPRIQPFQRLPEIPPEDDLAIGLPPQGAVFAQHLLVIGIDHLPAQLIVEQGCGAVLNQYVFGIVVGHGTLS